MSQLSKLDLEYVYLIRIEKDTFKGLCGLRELHLNCCGIERIENGSIAHLKQLTKLILSGNKLQRIDKDMFAALGAQLEGLDISECKTEIIEVGAFSHLSMLWKLNIGSNDLRRINKGIFYGLSQLTDLDLNDCKIEHIEHDALLSTAVRRGSTCITTTYRCRRASRRPTLR